MTNIEIPAKHPRAASLRTRETLIEQWRKGIVASSGLIAHGRGEAFDYLLGEDTTKLALSAIKAAAVTLLTAKNPVISVNGNVAALVAGDIVRLSKATRAKIEVNLFYRSAEREKAIRDLLKSAGALGILGVGTDASAKIPELGSERRRVDPRGIFAADVVLVPLEDGDRTEALVKMHKKVIAVDLNPLSRTAQTASITIVDNIVRAIPRLVETVTRLRKQSQDECKRILAGFDNRGNLNQSIAFINRRLSKLARKGEPITLGGEPLGL